MPYPIKVIVCYVLIVTAIVLAFRIGNGFWPPLGLNIGLAVGGSYSLYRWAQKRTR